MASTDTVDDGKPTAGGDEETEVTTDHNGDVKKAPLDEPEDKPFPFRRLLAYADGFDWFLMALGTLGSVVHGMAQPIGYYLLGKALDAFGNNINDDKATVDALFQVVPFVWAMAFATLPEIIFLVAWSITSWNNLQYMSIAFQHR